MIEDLTKLLDKEEGSVFSPEDLLFSDFEGGGVFNYGETDPQDFTEMFKQDGKARSLESVLSLPVRSAPWSIDRDKAKAKVHETVMKVLTTPANGGGMSTPLDLVIAQICGSFVNRKSFHEKVITERDGIYVYDKIAWRPASTCAVIREEKTGAFKGFKQKPVRQADTKEIKIEAARALVHINGQHRNPLEGVSDMDIAYWCYETKQKIRFLWYSFLEGQALPKTIVTHRDQGTATSAAKKIAGLRQGGIAAITEDVKVEAFESSGKGAAEFQAALRWLDQEASGSVMAGFTDLTSAAAGGVGSYALSKDSSDFFLMGRTAASREVENTINQFLIPDIVSWNFPTKTECPTFKFGPIQEESAEAALGLLTKLATTPDSKLPDEFFDELAAKTAAYLDLDIEKVRDGLERVRREAEERAAAMPPEMAVPPGVAGVAGAVQAASQAVQAGPPGAPVVPPVAA